MGSGVGTEGNSTSKLCAGNGPDSIRRCAHPARAIISAVSETYKARTAQSGDGSAQGAGRISRLQRALNQVRWIETLTFTSFGLTLGIRSNCVGLLDDLADLLPPGWQPIESAIVNTELSLYRRTRPDQTVETYTLYAGSEKIVRTQSREAALRFLASQVEQHVAEYAPEFVFVHAGVVGWNERALVFPGRTFTGKSTLVAALLRAGATYYSDEYAVFDNEGKVHPYPRKLSLRDAETQAAVRQVPQALGARVGETPLTVGLILCSAYKADTQFQTRRLTPGEAVMALIANSLCARSRPEAAMAVLRNAVRSGVALKGTRGEAEEAAAHLLTLLEGGPSEGLGASAELPGEPRKTANRGR